MITRKTSCLVVVLLVTTITNLYSMDRPPEENVSELVGKVLLGMEEPRTLSLVDLPKDILHQIVQFVSLYSTAESLEIAANNVNSLSSVSKSLHTKLNDPIFCLQLIKDLAKKFNCTDYDACKALKTSAAKERLKLQLELYALCCNLEPLDAKGNPVSPEHYGNFLFPHQKFISENPHLNHNYKRHLDYQKFLILHPYLHNVQQPLDYKQAGYQILPENYDFEQHLNSLRQQNVDLEFTYPIYPVWEFKDLHELQSLYKSGLTPLMVASTMYLRPPKAPIDYIGKDPDLANYRKISKLLISHGANINGTNNNGDTVFMLLTSEGGFEMLYVFCEENKQSIDINKQNNQGDTALMYSTNSLPRHFVAYYTRQETILVMINYLVADVKADPNIMNNKGMTLLDYEKENIHFSPEVAHLLPIALQGQFTTRQFQNAVFDYQEQQQLYHQQQRYQYEYPAENK